MKKKESARCEVLPDVTSTVMKRRRRGGGVEIKGFVGLKMERIKRRV